MVEAQLVVHAPGSTVLIGGPQERLRGLIVQVCLTACNRVQYQVAWWNGRERKHEWLEAREVQPMDSTSKTAIGFR